MKEFIQVIVHCNENDQSNKSIERLGRIKYKLPMINACVIEVDPKNVEKIEQLQEVEKVEIDTHITAQMKKARDIINLDYAHKRKIYGNNIGVAILDTGIYEHRDFLDNKNKSRITTFVDFVNKRNRIYDDNGHGTHVSGIIGGNGGQSNGMYVGVAPKCNIISVKVLNYKGNGNISDVLAGIQWVIDNRKRYNIRVVNISVGTASDNSIDESSVLVKGVNAAWDQGLVVVVAAGNNGPNPMSITTPGISRKIITVGASDDDIAVNIHGDKVRDYSGRGPTFSCIKKPDIVAPGSDIISCNSMNNRKGGQNEEYIGKSGTSMSTPIVSGAIALLLSINPNMTNKDVKMKLRTSGDDLGFGQAKQGWGLLNVKKLLE